jgi:hypothetical protein
MLVCGRHGQLSYPCGTAAVLPQTLPDTSAVAVRDAVQVPDTRGRSVASDVPQRHAVLREPVTGAAAAGGRNQRR